MSSKKIKDVTNGRLLTHKHSRKKNYNSEQVIFHNFYMSKYVQQKNMTIYIYISIYMYICIYI